MCDFYYDRLLSPADRLTKEDIQGSGQRMLVILLASPDAPDVTPHLLWEALWDSPVRGEVGQWGQ